MTVSETSLIFRKLNGFEEYWSCTRRMSLTWGHSLSNVFLMIRLGLWVLEGRPQGCSAILTTSFQCPPMFAGEETEVQTGQWPAQASRRAGTQVDPLCLSPKSMLLLRHDITLFWGSKGVVTRFQKDGPLFE